MREFKFRLYNTDDDKMELHDNKGAFLVAEAHDWPVMQYTGLKDKNGKEIYEGDIVKWFTDSMWKFAEVVYGGRGWELHWSKSEPERQWRERPVLFELQSFWPLGDERDIQDSKFEVIGNIYENPELLS